MDSTKCPQCNLVNFSGTQTCKRCGMSLTRQPIQNLTRLSRSSNSQSEKVSTTCPRCQCADTQSFHMAYQAGTSKGTVNVMSYNPDIGITSSGGAVSNQTMLAKQVSPPTLDGADNGVLAAVLLTIVSFTILFPIMAVLFSPIFKADNDFINLTALLASFIVTSIAAFFVARHVYQAEAKKFESRKVVHQNALAKWSRSWICLRCGSSWLI